MRHCEYILLAEFDIDEGTVLRDEYPVSTGTNDQLLAELMVPDGAHAQQEDWTVFYLNQTPATTVHTELRDGLDEEGAGAVAESEKKPLLYVMSLVRTKHGQAYKRGAIVKAMAVVSRHPFIQIFKPVLLLALEDYFNEPSSLVLKRLYDSINAIDMSLAPQLSLDERLILRQSERKNLFEEKFDRPPAGRRSEDDRNSASAADQQSSLSSSMGPGASRRSVTPTSGMEELSLQENGGLHVPGGNGAGNGSAGAPRSRVVSDSSTNGGISMARTGSSGTTGAASGRSISSRILLRDTHFYDTSVLYNGLSLPIRLPLATFPAEVGDYSLITLVQTFSNFTGTLGPLHPHLHTNGALTPPVLVLFNALVTWKRILFLGGKDQPASLVSNYVLAACALGSGCGTLFGTTLTERALPYSNLTNLDNQLSIAGYIAGVTNPRFEDLTSTWDVLCNIQTGRITISKDIQQGATGSFSGPLSNPSLLSLSTTSSAGGYSAGSEVMVSATPEPMSALSGSMPFGREGQGITSQLGTGSSSLPETLSDPDLNSSHTRELPTSSMAGMGGGTGSVSTASHGGVGSMGAQSGGATTSKMEQRLDSSDNLFMDEVISAIQSHFGEAVIRSRFTDYARRFVRLASRWEEETYGTTSIDWPSSPFTAPNKLGSGLVVAGSPNADDFRRELLANGGRIEGWRRTKAYEQYKQEWMSAQGQERTRGRSAVKGWDLPHQISKLRVAKKLGDDEVQAIFDRLVDGIKTDEQVIELLAHLPSHAGGLLPVAFGVFHPQASVRNSVVDLLTLLDAHPTGNKFLSSLNRFHKLAFSRLAQERGISLAARGAGGDFEYSHVTGRMVGVKNPGRLGEGFGAGGTQGFIDSRTTGQGGYSMPQGYVHNGATDKVHGVPVQPLSSQMAGLPPPVPEGSASWHTRQKSAGTNNYSSGGRKMSNEAREYAQTREGTGLDNPLPPTPTSG